MMSISSPIFTALLAVAGASLQFRCDAAVVVGAALSNDVAKRQTPARQGHAPHRLQQQEQTVCSCSPQSYSFQLSLNNDCSSSTLSGDDDGISNTNCRITASEFENARRVVLADNLLSQIQSALPKITKRLTDRQSPTQTSNTTVAYISSVLFIEFDTSGTLSLINEDTRYLANVNFTEGRTITYSSISQSLNASLGLGEQLQYVPGGAGLFIFGNNNEGEVILSSRVVWEFSGACDVAVEIEGKTLGWIDFVETVPAQSEFCPVAMSGTTAPTLAPTTESPTSDSPYASPDPISVTGSPIGKSSTQPTAKASKMFKSHNGSKSNDQSAMESKSSKVMSIHAKNAKAMFSKVGKDSSEKNSKRENNSDVRFRLFHVVRLNE
ncbi:hypothetical protein ACHAW5_005135 [Stephanodiscus triporus]|uniref:Uncharacterized protein n=1 Tax=Stephanodiscus triporus TaxID=2934178 RepID=A0ABD3MU01_9STRA